MSDHTATLPLLQDDGTIPCAHCGQLIPFTDAIEVSTSTGIDLWCGECAEADATECDRCGVLESKDDTDVVGDDVWCHECVDYYAVVCERCGELVDEDDAETVRTGSYGQASTQVWCRHCADHHATRCDHCGELFDDDDGGENFDVCNNGCMDLCYRCVEDNYYVCDDCGDLVSIDDVVTDEWGEHFCPNCRNADLQSYGHTYATEFYTARMETTPNLFLGVELETEADGCAGDLATSILDAAGRTRLCCKQDSSLEDGCEVVTQPCTPAYHLTSDLWPSVLAACDGAATSHDNGRCGLHVHINRDFFGAPDERDARICTLDRLIQTHADEWTRFARRTRPQIERWCAIESDEQLGIERGDDAKTKRDKWTKGKGRFNRYKALNLSNTETVELRLWRGTLNPETLRATIEATAAIALIARNCADPEAVESWTWGVLKREMINALGRCGLPSADLAAYLDRRGL